MTNKELKEKILTEIEKLRRENKNIQCIFNHDYCIGYDDALDDITKPINSLPDEKCEGLEEAAEKKYPVYWKDYPKDGIVRSELSYDTNKQCRDAFIAGADWREEQFEKNRLAACDAQTKEEYERETDFATSIIEKEHRQPTFSDAIEYGMRIAKEQMMKDGNIILTEEDFDAEKEKSMEWGYNLCKEQIMKDAVEREVHKYDKFSYIEEKNSKSLTELLTKFNNSDKVHIIILKAEEKKK